MASACFQSTIFFNVFALSMSLLVYDVILLFSVKSEYSIILSKQVIVWANSGCDMAFPYGMAKLRHLRKGCNGARPDQMIVKVGEHWECKLCRTHIKHPNNITLTKKIVQKLYKMYTKIIQNTWFVYILYTKIIQIKILFDNECRKNVH